MHPVSSPHSGTVSGAVTGSLSGPDCPAGREPDPAHAYQPAFVTVLLDGPLAGSYTYRVPAGMAVAPGQWAVVPWGKARRVGVVEALTDFSTVAEEKVRALEQLLPELPALAPQWLDFIRFAAGYYQGEPAELGLGSVPKLLRVPPSARTRKRADSRLAAFDPAPAATSELHARQAAPARLTPEISFDPSARLLR